MTGSPSRSPITYDRPLTAKHLRDLVKLHRAGVDGAESALRHLLEHHRSGLVHVLETSSRMIELIYDNPNPVEALLEVHAATERVRRHRRRGPPHTTTSLYHEVRFQHFGVVELPAWRLWNLVRTWKKGLIAFEDRGYIDVGLVRAVLRNCMTQRSTITKLEAAVRVLRFSYRTRGGSGGWISLHYQHPPKKEIANIPIHRLSFSAPSNPETEETTVTEKKTYTLHATVTVNVELDVEAESVEEAHRLAREAGVDDWRRVGHELIVDSVYTDDKCVWDAETADEPRRSVAT